MDYKSVEPNGTQDVYSDATPCDGKKAPLSLENMSKAQLLEIRAHLEKPRKVVRHNPSAGEIHAQEASAPWLAAAATAVTLENEKAAAEQREKRIWGLARQTTVGLKNRFNLNYGVAELATKLRVGDAQRSTSNNSEKDGNAAALIVAVEQYDLKRIALLLGLKPKVPLDNI